MKNSLKKMALAISLIASISTLATTPALAETNNTEVIYYEESITTDKFVDESLVGTKKVPTITPFNNYGESQVTTNLVTYDDVYVIPSGQPADGYIGNSGASVFFFQTGGSSTKFTVKIDYKNVEFTAETGTSASYGSGYEAKVPSFSGRHRFKFHKAYTIRTKKIDVYKYGVYSYTYYVHTPSYALGHIWVRV